MAKAKNVRTIYDGGPLNEESNDWNGFRVNTLDWDGDFTMALQWVYKDDSTYPSRGPGVILPKPFHSAMYLIMELAGKLPPRYHLELVEDLVPLQELDEADSQA